MKFLAFVALTLAAMAGLYFQVPYSGWVLFVALIGVICT